MPDAIIAAPNWPISQKAQILREALWWTVLLLRLMSFELMPHCLQDGVQSSILPHGGTESPML